MASIYTFFAPANAGRNVSIRFTVSVLPAADTLDPLPLNTHWLFCCVPLPGVIELAGAAPASVKSVSVFCARLYITAQALAVALTVELNKTPTVLRSVGCQGIRHPEAEPLLRAAARRRSHCHSHNRRRGPYTLQLPIHRLISADRLGV